MEKNKKLRTITISGLLAPSEWDEDDNITNVTLTTMEEEEYKIKNNEKGRELLEYISHDVIIRGYEEEDEAGDKIITVNEYEVIGEKVAEEEDFDYEDNFYEENEESDLENEDDDYYDYDDESFN